MTTHKVRSVHFPTGKSTGPVECTCGWSGEYRQVPGYSHSDTFSLHRAEQGQRVAYVSDPIATPDSPPFQKRLTKCKRNHEPPNWRPRLNGGRECVTCVRDLLRESRRRRRAVVA